MIQAFHVLEEIAMASLLHSNFILRRKGEHEIIVIEKILSSLIITRYVIGETALEPVKVSDKIMLACPSPVRFIFEWGECVYIVLELGEIVYQLRLSKMFSISVEESSNPMDKKRRHEVSYLESSDWPQTRTVDAFHDYTRILISIREGEAISGFSAGYLILKGLVDGNNQSFCLYSLERLSRCMLGHLPSPVKAIIPLTVLPGSILLLLNDGAVYKVDQPQQAALVQISRFSDIDQTVVSVIEVTTGPQPFILLISADGILDFHLKEESFSEFFDGDVMVEESVTFQRISFSLNPLSIIKCLKYGNFLYMLSSSAVNGKKSICGGGSSGGGGGLIYRISTLSQIHHASFWECLIDFPHISDIYILEPMGSLVARQRNRLLYLGNSVETFFAAESIKDLSLTMSIACSQKSDIESTLNRNLEREMFAHKRVFDWTLTVKFLKALRANPNLIKCAIKVVPALHPLSRRIALKVTITNVSYDYEFDEKFWSLYVSVRPGPCFKKPFRLDQNSSGCHVFELDVNDEMIFSESKVSVYLCNPKEDISENPLPLVPVLQSWRFDIFHILLAKDRGTHYFMEEPESQGNKDDDVQANFFEREIVLRMQQNDSVGGIFTWIQIMLDKDRDRSIGCIESDEGGFESLSFGPYQINVTFVEDKKIESATSCKLVKITISSRAEHEWIVHSVCSAIYHRLRCLCDVYFPSEWPDNTLYDLPQSMIVKVEKVGKSESTLISTISNEQISFRLQSIQPEENKHDTDNVKNIDNNNPNFVPTILQKASHFFLRKQ